LKIFWDCRRFYLEVVGRRRFTIQESWEQDGYRVAAPQFFGDEPPQPGSTEAIELAALSTAVEARADAWVDRVKCAPPSLFPTTVFHTVLYSHVY
jgi:Lon protease-like protein